MGVAGGRRAARRCRAPILAARTDSTWLTFLAPLVVAGRGLGLTLAPMTTVAVHDITPSLGGSASSVLNTTRQLGAVIGSAVVGAVLQKPAGGVLPRSGGRRAAQLPGGLPP